MTVAHPEYVNKGIIKQFHALELSEWKSINAVLKYLSNRFRVAQSHVYRLIKNKINHPGTPKGYMEKKKAPIDVANFISRNRKKSIKKVLGKTYFPIWLVEEISSAINK